MRKILVILVIFLLGGCALRTSNITYPIVRPIEGLSVLEKGNLFQSCLLKQEKIANSYKVIRENYVLYIVLGNKHTPEVYLGAKDKQNNILNMKMNNISENDFFNNLLKNEYFPNKEKIKKYGLSKLYSTRIFFDESSRKETISHFGPITLEIYDLKGKKVDNLKLEFDLKSFECKGVETI